jgi:hypothetical protein
MIFQDTHRCIDLLGSIAALSEDSGHAIHIEVTDRLLNPEAKSLDESDLLGSFVRRYLGYEKQVAYKMT